MLLNRMVFNSDQDCPRIGLDIRWFTAGTRRTARRTRGRGDKRERGGRGDRHERGGRPNVEGGESFDDVDSEGGDNADILRRQASSTQPRKPSAGANAGHVAQNECHDAGSFTSLPEDPEITPTESMATGSLKKW